MKSSLKIPKPNTAQGGLNIADRPSVANMRRQEQVREVIVNGLSAGMTPTNIIKAHKLKQSTVYNVKKRFEAFLAAGGSPDSFSSRKHIVRRDPGKSMGAIAAKMKVQERTVRRIMKEERRYKSCAMRKGQFRSEEIKSRRFEKAKKLPYSKYPDGRCYLVVNGYVVTLFLVKYFL
jgi:hypothetical protein